MLKVKRYQFSSILGWSVTRYDTFIACKRMYYYQYYAKFDPDYLRMKIDELKNLNSIPLEIGNIVHDTISTVLRRLLKSNNEIDRDRFEEPERSPACRLFAKNIRRQSLTTEDLFLQSTG